MHFVLLEDILQKYVGFEKKTVLDETKRLNSF